MKVHDFVRRWLDARDDSCELVAHHVQAPREARTAPYPDWVHPPLRRALEGRGIVSLYTHQSRAADLLHRGKNVTSGIRHRCCRRGRDRGARHGRLTVAGGGADGRRGEIRLCAATPHQSQHKCRGDAVACPLCGGKEPLLRHDR